MYLNGISHNVFHPPASLHLLSPWLQDAAVYLTFSPVTATAIDLDIETKNKERKKKRKREKKERKGDEGNIWHKGSYLRTTD